LKSGAFGTVCRGTHRSTQKSVAVKVVRRDRLQPNADVAILREVHLHGSLKHDSIIPIVDFFMEDQCYFIVMELMEGGDVFDRIGSLKQYNEEIARDLCTKLLKAVAHCHENNIVHCDLKPNNLLLKSIDDHASVMVADFGFARHVFAPKSIIEQRGTPYFIAPEIICRDPYDQSADMWSVGVIIYCLISGQMPFVGKRTIDLFKAILNQDYDFSDKAWDNVSDSAKDLISKLLVTDPNERYTAIDALNSTWISNSDKFSLTLNSLTESASNMKTFSARLKLKTAILTVQSVTRWKLVLKNKDPIRRPSAVPGDLTECV
jgi:calcium/calmodulin-dependent protein kinase I